MAVVIDVGEGERKIDRVERSRWNEVDMSTGKTSVPVAIVDVESPALKGGDNVHVPIVIEIPDDDGPARHGPSRSGSGQRGVELPVAFSIAQVDLDAGFCVSDENQVQFAVTIDIHELRCHIPVLAAHQRFRETSLP